MANNRQSLSEQSQRRGNLILLIIGLVLLLLFLLALCQLSPRKQDLYPQEEENPIGTRFRPIDSGDGQDPDVVVFTPGEGRLIAQPSIISMNSVVGKQSEVEITLKAEKAGIRLESKKILNEKDNVFALDGSCMEKGKDVLNIDEECTILLSWQSATPRQLKNTLQIDWREDDDRTTLVQKLQIPIDIQVSDSNPCVICKCDEKSKPDVKTKVIPITNDPPIPVDDNDEVEIDGEKYPVRPGEPIMKGNKVLAVPQPEYVPLNLKNELMGTVAKNREVLDFNDKVIGRLLDDDTIVNDQLEVLGKAIPVVYVMKENGEIIGKVDVDHENKSVRVVRMDNGQKQVIGYPRVDKQVVDLDGKHLAFLAPWGAVISFSGDFLGITFPQKTGGKDVMAVRDEKQQTLGYMRPMGLAVTKNGEVIGGMVPSGVVVGGGCRSYGAIDEKGQVYDALKQRVGHVLLDKSFVDVHGNELGSVVRQGVVIDNKGKVVGFINSEGVPVNAEGTQIGCVNPDGSVFDKEKFVGVVMPEGRVIKEACGQVGSVYPNAEVISLEMQKLGNVLPDGTAVSEKKKLGWVAPQGTVIAQNCQLLGLISLNGTVVSVDGTSLGCLTQDKKVQDLKGSIIGMVTPTGIQMNEKNQIIGRIGLDGYIIGNGGKIVGCVNSLQNVISNSTRGVVIDENGFPTGWSFVAGKTYSTSGAWMGDVSYNGWVIGEKHQLVGVVPFSGSVFSNRGEIVGQYNQMSGAVVNRAGQSIGRVLPGMSVINNSATEILGVLIPEETVYVDLQGKVLGTLRTDGVLVNQGQEIPAKILANGSMVDEKGKILGGRLPTGPVLNMAGKYVGSVTRNGDFIDESGIKAGHALANGLVVSDQKQVLGMVFPALSTAIGVEGWLGSLNPQLVQESEKVSYEGQVTDIKGNLAGKISAAGQVLGLDQTIKGSLVPIAPFVTLKGNLMGWTNFHGEVNGPEGRSVANILPSGLAISAAQQLQGVVVNPTAIVGTQGEYLGHTTANGRLLSDKGEVLAIVGLTRFVYDTQGVLLGQLLPPGIAVDADNHLIGWTRYDGQIEDGSKVIGQVGLDRHVFDENGQMIGVYIPMGQVEFSSNNQSSGLVNEKGFVQSVGGAEIAMTASMPFVSDKAVITGRLLDQSLFTAPLNASNTRGIVSDDGKTYSLATRRETGFVMTNAYTVGSAGLTDGGILPLGSAIGTTLGILGQVYPDGGIYNTQKQIAASTGTGLVFSLAGELIGGIFKPGVIIDKKGLIVATTGATAAVMDKGKQVASKMAFASALTSTNKWLGNLMPRGAVVNDYAETIGTLSLDGSLLNAENNFIGRVLPDGSVAGVPQKSVYNTMPYTGHTIAQGLPLGYHKEILGRTTSMGDVVDKNNRNVGRIRDIASIFGEARKPLGVVIPFISAVGKDGKLLGTVSPDGKVVSFEGENMGTVATNRLVKGNNPELGEFDIRGTLVNEDLIVNNCQVVGQTAYDGRIISGQGAVLGRILKDRTAVDSQGGPIGYIAKKGPVTTEKSGTYIGRILPDGTMVNLDGVEVACSDLEGNLTDIQTGDIYLDPGTGEGAKVINMGPIIGENGELTNMWIDSTGRVHDGKQNDLVIGQLNGSNQVVDENGNVIKDLYVLSDTQEIIFDPNNPDRVIGVLDVDGTIRNEKLEFVARVTDDNIFVDEFNRPLTPGVLSSGGVGRKYYFENCALFDSETREQVAFLTPDGRLLDEDGQNFATMSSDGEIRSFNGAVMDKLVGINLDFQKCGMKESAGEHKICMGNKCYVLGADGTLRDPETDLVEYRYDPTLGRIFDFNDQVVDVKTGRPPVEKPKPPKVNPEDREVIQQKLAQKRQSMRQKLGGAPLTMSAEMQARYKPKKDKDWASVGVGKDSISSWPVDMTHVILQGRTIPAVLARSIDSRFADTPALAIVDTNIYAEEGRNILIPAGSQLIGRYDGESATQPGVAKINISWERLIRPDGVAFNLNASQSADVMGRGGISAYLDEQLVSKYSTAITGTLAQSAVAYMIATNEDANMSDSGNSSQSNKSQAANDARSAFLKKFGDIVDDWIEHAESIQPIVYVPIGTRLNVVLSQDLWLRSAADDEESVNSEYGAPPTAAQRPDMPSWEENRRQQLNETSDRNINIQDQNNNGRSSAQNNGRVNASDTGRGGARNSANNKASQDAQNLATPIYDETDRMQEGALQDRVVEPVPASQTPPMF